MISCCDCGWDLNSGQVIAGEIGSGALGYTTIGEQVGLAQRMESIAPEDGVMLSAATARLVEQSAVLGPPESVMVKGQDAAVEVRQLLAVTADRSPQRVRWEAPLVGRSDELDTVAALLGPPGSDRVITVRLVGPAGIGKTRLVEEVSRLAAARAIPVYPTYCESHTSSVPFSAAARLLRAMFAVSDAQPDAARAQVRLEMTDVKPEDLLLLDDLLGIGDPLVALPDVTPEARQRRAGRAVAERHPGAPPFGSVCDRGCALDRRGERINVRRAR